MRIADRLAVGLALPLALALATLAGRFEAGQPQAPGGGPGLGVAASPAELRAWDLSVYPDGRGLPDGAGTAESGRSVYRERCAACHGPQGEGGSGGHLAGRGSLSDPDPDQTVGNYWPYATTLFDFIRRAMPMDAPGSLRNDEIYAVSAYVLYLNGIVGLQDRLDAHSLPRIRMPNRDGFTGIDAPLPPADARSAGSR
jgi:S-disulfanyl-L-cysteine oxidoreductase SoxD